jgi:hypothetical protein
VVGWGRVSVRKRMGRRGRTVGGDDGDSDRGSRRRVRRSGGTQEGEERSDEGVVSEVVVELTFDTVLYAQDSSVRPQSRVNERTMRVKG